MESLLQDLRYGLRTLLRRPGFTAVAALTLALGIGANTALFSVVNGVLLRPLPYAEPERLVMIWEDPGTIPRNYVNPRNFADWRDENQSFEKVAAIVTQSTNLTGTGEPERLIGAQVSASFFTVLRAHAALGRTFLPEEDQPGSSRVVVLSHGLWQRRFGADPGILGRTLTLNGQDATVVGVMPAGFQFPQRVEFWAPLVFTPQMLAQTSRGSHYLRVVGRLNDGVSVAQAQAEIDTIYNRLRQQHPESLTNWRANVFSLHEDTVAEVRPSLLVLLGAVCFVLLIACANVANLTLARATARQREIAIRAALGAGRFRLTRQLLTESVLLALLGGGLGILAALWGVDLLLSLSPGNVPRMDEVGIDGRVLGFSLLITLLSALIFGLTPALQASRVDLNESLKEAGTRAGAGGRQQYLRRTFVVAEVALSFVLLVGAGLMIKSFIQLGRVDLGFTPENLLTLRVSLPATRYREPAQQISFYQQVTERVKNIPGVESAALISDPPVSGSTGLWQNAFHIDGKPLPPPGERHFAYLRWVTPDYFRAIGVPLLRGRLFKDSDLDGKPWVTIIDEAMAQKFFPGEDPIGKRIVIYMGERNPREIVGVVGNVRQTGLEDEAGPHTYVPYFQTPLNYAALVVRTPAAAAGMAEAVKKAVLAVDPAQPIYSVQTMDQIISNSTAQRRFNLLLLAIFAATALLLAAVGIYGVMSYTVSQRTQEIGIRIALGAQTRDVLRLVVGQGLKLALIGVGLGLVAALGLTRLMSKLLFGVSATDPATFVVITGVIAAAALLACYLPARRATKVDPMVALRYE